MTPAEISRAKGGEVFTFDYSSCDLADTFTFGAGSWGLYSADATVSVGNTITPGVADDSLTSVAGAITFSVTLFHLDAFTSSHVEWAGSGVTVEVTKDGGLTWAALAEDGVVDLAGDPDFDIRVSFAGGVEDDPSELVSMTVYVFKTETMYSDKVRSLAFSADPMTDDGLVVNSLITIAASDDPDSVTGTIELIATQGTGAILPAGTTYQNGNHIVIVRSVADNTPFNLGPNMTISHLALYPQAMSAAEANTLVNGLPVLQIQDTGSVGVTESSPATDIYAYAWSVVSGGKA